MSGNNRIIGPEKFLLEKALTIALPVAITKRLMAMFKESGYDKITGDWNPEDWQDDNGLHFYPPASGTSYPEEWNEISPHPELKTTSIGRGHLFNALIDVSTDYVEPSYKIYGISKNKEDAEDECGRYANFHKEKYASMLSNGLPYKDNDYVQSWNEPIVDGKNNVVGHRWAQDHVIPNKAGYGSFLAKKLIESTHKKLYDMNNKNTRIAKVYTTDIDCEGYYITKIAEIEQFAPTGVGSGFTGMDSPDQTVGDDPNSLSGTATDNQPEGISETIPGKSFYNHDMLASKLFLAEIEDMNYQGIGPEFGKGMGPQDFSNNAADVEEGPAAPKSTDHSTTQLPLSLQGQEILPDLTSWYTASSIFNDDEYEYHKSKDHKLFEKEEADDDSDEDDEDDYTNNNNW
jgi:hypothetical protein